MADYKAIFTIIVASSSLTISLAIIYLLMYLNISLIVAFVGLGITYGVAVILYTTFEKRDIRIFANFLLILGVLLILGYFVEVPFVSLQTVSAPVRHTLSYDSFVLQQNQTEELSFWGYSLDELYNETIVEINVTSNASLILNLETFFFYNPSAFREKRTINFTEGRTFSTFWTPPTNDSTFDLVLSNPSLFSKTAVDCRVVAFYQADRIVEVSDRRHFLDTLFVYVGVASICVGIGLNVFHSIRQTRKTTTKQT